MKLRSGNGQREIQLIGECFNRSFKTTQVGASSIDVGRNIWQNAHPIAVINAIRSIVHMKATVKEAVIVFEENKKTHVQLKRVEFV